MVRMGNEKKKEGNEKKGGQGKRRRQVSGAATGLSRQTNTEGPRQVLPWDRAQLSPDLQCYTIHILYVPQSWDVVLQVIKSFVATALSAAHKNIMCGQSMHAIDCVSYCPHTSSSPNMSWCT